MSAPAEDFQRAPVNAFKRRLRAGETLIGIWAGLASPYSVEICAASGMDWVLIDGEHAPNDVRSILGQLQAVASHRAAPVVRPPSGEAWMIKQYLDIGAQTLLVPMVDTAQQARALVAATRYPPLGVRGVGAALARASWFGRRGDYIASADEQICLLVQVETSTALEHLVDIARTDGVDGVFIGPADLAASLGHPGNPSHPAVQQAIEGAIASIAAAGKAPGILTSDPALARRYLELGARFVAVGTDVTLLARGIDSLAGHFGRGRGGEHNPQGTY
ncbi:4-hydroxy-2-oxoheptanedioate aldolase [Cupriavidus basilensis]|uniref:4-hydroxy-2-oxoheptanedioate aldolase n=1 Tax=Cupriavidus basilensis TaxID=68895 RepID=UPI0007512398|nr:4-hydroxy-2-oxoheptanedioate aldolase [Cupriavidus basilensis]